MSEANQKKNGIDLDVIRQVPRINMHAFCETQETFERMQQVAEDRRMARSHVRIHRGGMSSALEFLSSDTIPNLVMIESKNDRENLLESLQELAKHCDPQIKVMIVGYQNDINLYRELILLGVSDYIVHPVSSLDIMRSISKIFGDPSSAPVGKTIAFVSSKGGVGSSTLAHNVAWSIASSFNLEVIIADLDLPFGTANINFDQDPERGIADAVFSPERIDEVYLDRLLSECTEHVYLLAAPLTLERVYDLDPEAFSRVIEVAQRNASFVILDVPHVWNGWTKEILRHADEIVMTAMPDLASLRNTKNFLDVMKKIRPNDTLPKLVINQTGVPKRPEISAEEFSRSLGVSAFAVIPFEPVLFGKASNNGRMLGEIEEHNPVSRTIAEMSHILTGYQTARLEKKNFIQHLFKKIK